MKITKSKLAQIVQEELQAVTAEGYKAYKRDDKNKNPKGLSPQYRFTDAASTDDTEERFHKSEHSPYSDKKPKRGLEEAGEDMDTLDSHMLGREHALAVFQGEMDEDDTYLKRMRDEAYGAGFDDAMKELDPQSSWDDEGGFDNDDMYENKITKSKLVQIIQEELKATLSEDLAPYSNLKGYVLQALRDLGGEQPVSDIAAEVMEPWAADNWSAEDGIIDEEGMFYSVKEALESLEVDGRVRLTQGGPGSTNEDFYVLAQ